MYVDRFLKVISFDYQQYEVILGYDAYVVDIGSMTCAYRTWQLTCYHCVHRYACIASLNRDVEEESGHNRTTCPQKPIEESLNASSKNKKPKKASEVKVALAHGVDIESDSEDEMESESEVKSFNVEFEVDVQDEVQPEVQDEVQHEVQPEVQDNVQDEVQAEVQHEVQTQVHPKVYPEVQDEVHSEVHPEVQAEVHPEVQPEVQVQAKDDNQIAVQDQVEVPTCQVLVG
ncbi:unnamed protein product [Lactuca saligna]|uniref:Uncharacterized protein n=1 Tax=Lactuca saligna TaxID=75948 RepID=A0AA35YEF5_LACSI|nr:unnamed protein product [Lactuca saligna]